MWHFAGQLILKVTDALAPMAFRDTVRLHPLKSFAATIASAHMLAWVHAAFGHGVEVDKYLDTAEEVLSILPGRRRWVSETALKPRITSHPNQDIDAGGRHAVDIFVQLQTAFLGFLLGSASFVWPQGRGQAAA